MIEVVEKRLDPHLRTGSLISGAPEDFVTLENEVVGNRTDPLDIADARRQLPEKWNGISIDKFFMPRSMSIRQAGKKGDHGLNYGEQYKTFALINELEESDAKHIVSIYRDVAYPGLKSYYRDVAETLRRDNRFLTNCFGQTRQFLDRMDHKLLLAAYAFVPQSTVGNITNFGLRSTYQVTTAPMDKVIPAAQIHDSNLNQHTFDSWEEAAEQVATCRRFMDFVCTYHGVEFTIRTSAKIGKTWGGGDMIEIEQDEGDYMTPGAIEKAWEASRASKM
jgi:hypothetical protein